MSFPLGENRFALLQICEDNDNEVDDCDAANEDIPFVAAHVPASSRKANQKKRRNKKNKKVSTVSSIGQPTVPISSSIGTWGHVSSVVGRLNPFYTPTAHENNNRIFPINVY